MTSQRVKHSSDQAFNNYHPFRVPFHPPQSLLQRETRSTDHRSRSAASPSL